MLLKMVLVVGEYSLLRWIIRLKRASLRLGGHRFGGQVVHWPILAAARAVFVAFLSCILINLAHREYFKKAGRWKLPGTEGKFFMLEPITSQTSGEKITAISMRLSPPRRIRGLTGPLTTAALTTRPTSTADTIMPPGYAFCIIDAAGVVQYHSDDRLSLEENLFEETENDTELRSAVSGARGRYINLHYHNTTRFFNT